METTGNGFFCKVKNGIKRCCMWIMIRAIEKKMAQLRWRDFVWPFLCLFLEVFFFIECFNFELNDRERLKENVYEVGENIVIAFSDENRDEAKVIIRNFLFNIKSKTDDIVDMVVSFSAVSSSVVIMFYSLMDNRHLGIKNRTVMRYFLGLFTMPLIFSLILIKLPLLKILSSTEMYFTVLMGVGYTLVQQFLVIFLILLATSSPFSIWMITGQECWQYKRLFSEKNQKHSKFDIWDIQHIRFAMESSELFNEKAKLVRKVLLIPVTSSCLKKLEKGERRKYTRLFEYYYTHLLNAFKSAADADERNQLYNIVYDMLSDYLSIVKEQVEKKEWHIWIFHLICGATMLAAMMSEMKEREAFCNYILNEVIQDHTMRDRQIYYYFLGNDWLSRTNLACVQADQLGEIKGFYEWRLSDTDIYTGWQYWQIMLGMFSLTYEEMADTYFQAAATALGLDDTSIFISYCIQKKRRER